MRQHVRKDRFRCLTDKDQQEIETFNKNKAVYHKKVWDLTEGIAHLIPGIDKRGWRDHHIDHIFPVYQGFIMKVPEEYVADITNLRMLPYKHNMIKGKNIEI